MAIGIGKGAFRKKSYWQGQTGGNAGNTLADAKAVVVNSATGNTLNGSMREFFLAQAGTNGDWRDARRNYGNRIIGETGLLSQLQAIGGLTFYKDYRTTDTTLNADYSVGDGTATYAAARSASAPSTYVDDNGVIQLLTTANVRRRQGGYYDETGFHVQSGEMIEAAGTNLLVRTDGSAYGSGLWTGWVQSGTRTGTPTVSNVLIPSLCGIPNCASQRVQYTGEAGDSAGDKTIVITNVSTAVGSVVEGNVITCSFYARSTSGNTGISLRMDIIVRDAADSFVSAISSSDIASSLSNSWRKFSVTGTAPVNSSRCRTYPTVYAIGTGDVVDVEIYGIQLEASPHATSLIPTTTAALTRAADTLKYPISGNRTAGAESTVYKSVPHSPNTANLYCTFFNTDTKRRIAEINVTNQIEFFPNVDDSGALQAVKSLLSWNVNTAWLFVFICNHSSPYAEIYLNGSSIATDTTPDFTDNAWGTYFYIGTTNGINTVRGTVQTVAIFNKALTAAEVLLATQIINSGSL